MSADNIMYLVEETDGSFTGYHCFLSDLEEQNWSSSQESGDIVPFIETVRARGTKYFSAPDMRSAVQEVNDRFKDNVPLEYGYEFILKEFK